MNKKTFIYIALIILFSSPILSATIYVECGKTYTQDDTTYKLNKDLVCVEPIIFDSVKNSIFYGQYNTISALNWDTPIEIIDSYNFEIQKLYIEDVESCIIIEDSDKITLSRIDCDDSDDEGFYIYNSEEIRIFNSDFSDVGRYGIESESNYILWVSGCFFEDINYDGINSYNDNYVIVDNSKFRDVDDNPILIKNADGAEIKNNYFYTTNNNKQSLYLYNIDEILVHSNQFQSDYNSLYLNKIDDGDIYNNYFKMGFDLNGNFNNIKWYTSKSGTNIVGGNYIRGNYYEFWYGSNYDNNYDGISDEIFQMYSSYNVYDYYPLSKNYITNYYCDGTIRMAKTGLNNNIYIENCEYDIYNSWQRICKGNNVYETRTNQLKGCSNGACYSNSQSEEKFVESCTYKCSNGDCMQNSAPYFLDLLNTDGKFENPVLEDKNINNGIQKNKGKITFFTKIIDPNSDPSQIIVCNSNNFYNGKCQDLEYCKSNFGSGNVECSADLSNLKDKNENYAKAWVCDSFGLCSPSSSIYFYIDSIPTITKDKLETDEDEELNIYLPGITQDFYLNENTIKYQLISQSNPQFSNCKIENNFYLKCNPKTNTFGESKITLKVLDNWGQNSQKEITFKVNSINDLPIIYDNVKIINSKEKYNEDDIITFFSNSTDVESYSKMIICDESGIINNNCINEICSNQNNFEKHCSINLSSLNSKKWKGYICDDKECILSNSQEFYINDINFRNPLLFLNNKIIFEYSGIFKEIITGYNDTFQIQNDNLKFNFSLNQNSQIDIYYNISVEYDIINNPPKIILEKDYYEVNEGDFLEINFIIDDNDSIKQFISFNDSKLKLIKNNKLIWNTTYFDSGLYIVELNVSDSLENVTKNITINIINRNRLPFIDIKNYYSFSNDEDIKIEFNITDLDLDVLDVKTNSIGFITKENEKYYYNINKNESLNGYYNIEILINDSHDVIIKNLTINIYNIECYNVLDCPNIYNQYEKICKNNSVYESNKFYTCENAKTNESRCILNNNQTKVEICNNDCYKGECTFISCYNDLDCDTEKIVINECKYDNLYETHSKFICINSGTPDSYCEKKNFRYLIENCFYGCENNHCIEKENECIDSDGGIETSIYGVVNYNSKEYKDTCIEENYIEEYSCKNGDARKSILECSNGCLNGSCINGNYITKYEPTLSNFYFEKSTPIFFEINSSVLNPKYYWYVNDNLVSTYNYLNYQFISGNYEVKVELLYNGNINTKRWKVEINNSNLNNKLPDLYINKFNLLTFPLKINEFNSIEIQIGNFGEMSANNIDWKIYSFTNKLLKNGTLDLIDSGDIRILMTRINISQEDICLEINETCNYLFKIILDEDNKINEISKTNNNLIIK